VISACSQSDPSSLSDSSSSSSVSSSRSSRYLEYAASQNGLRVISFMRTLELELESDDLVAKDLDHALQRNCERRGRYDARSTVSFQLLYNVCSNIRHTVRRTAYQHHGLALARRTYVEKMKPTTIIV
jgi:hypothetical protein